MSSDYLSMGAGDPSYSSSSSSSSSSSLSASSLLDKAKSRPAYPLCALIAILSIIIIALSYALHVAQKDERSSPIPPPLVDSSTAPFYSFSSTSTPSPVPSSSSSTASSVPSLRELVTLDQLMVHARALQSIADRNGGNRYIHLAGFNASVAYIEATLRAHTNFHIFKQYFTRSGFEVQGTPPLVISDLTGDTFTLQYGADYAVYIFSAGLQCAAGCTLAYVRAGGCQPSDWSTASPPVLANSVVVLSRNASCNLATLNRYASSYSAIGVLVHNNDPTTGLLSLEGNAAYSAAFLTTTYEYGKLLELAITSSDPAFPPTVNLTLVTSYPQTVITNVCADTPSGDPTSTIVIGSHSDGVITGSGIVDNGSGTCANLVWAAAVSRLLQTPGFTPFPNRLRFCWWGAEEQGLLGSKYHVEVATNATEEGMRLQDYQLNLNFDMVACPNFVFGVLNGSSGADFPTTIPASVLPGSIALTNLFSEYFVANRMPWDGKAFNGRSDYGPFLTAGIPAGGVSAFIDRLKTVEERDRYNRMLGVGMGGIPNIAIDPCYHQRCDTIDNINTFAFEQIGKANGHVLQQLASMQPSDLKRLMFPQLAEDEPKPLFEPKDWPVEDGRYE